MLQFGGRAAKYGEGKQGRDKLCPYKSQERFMGVHLRIRWLVLGTICLIVLSLMSCRAEGVGVDNGSTAAGDVGMRKQSTSVDTAGGGTTSTIRFRVDGAVNGNYTLRSSTITSKLRHGHREFTIDIISGDRSIFLAFYGYDGPGTYRLAGHENGGDVRIDLGGNNAAWDLPMRQGVGCTLNIISQLASNSDGVDNMRGNFTCPMLTTAVAQSHPRNIRVSEGQFDLLIIVES
jgi:hypothetical protein